jgi:hypothetical protein
MLMLTQLIAALKSNCVKLNQKEGSGINEN